jgi:predicted NUDIX family NTP pyrophosphohydrolase
MTRRSAGILLYRGEGAGLELLLVHPGGPFWAKKDEGAWSIPKGEYDDDEDPLAMAIREFQEELGGRPFAGPTKLLNLGETVQPGGKRVMAFAVAGDFDPATIISNQFELEWPPNSGRLQSFPEVDRAEWFALPEAREKILPGQAPFLDRLLERLANRAELRDA